MKTMIWAVVSCTLLTVLVVMVLSHVAPVWVLALYAQLDAIWIINLQIALQKATTEVNRAYELVERSIEQIREGKR
jgi:hypothetical protein